MSDLVLDITPMGKPRMTQQDKWKKRPVIVRYRKYADALRLLCQINKFELPDELSITFVLPMPKSYLTKKGEVRKGKKEQGVDFGAKHQVKPDLDNMIKGVQDVLAKSDSFIHTYKNCTKVWGREGKIIFHL